MKLSRFDRIYLGQRKKCSTCGKHTAIYDLNGYLAQCDNCDNLTQKYLDIQDHINRVQAQYGDFDINDGDWQ